MATVSVGRAEIRVIAEEAAARVRSSGQEVELKSLSSAERRQVHTFFEGLWIWKPLAGQRAASLSSCAATVY